jgi:hypothetical protein
MARLTSEQRETLRQALTEELLNTQWERFTLSEITDEMKNLVDFDFNKQNVSYLFGECGYYAPMVLSHEQNNQTVFVVKLHESPVAYKVKKAQYVYDGNKNTFKKERNILTFDGCKDLVFDFNTKQFNIDIKQVYNLPTELNHFDNFCAYEWLFNYTNNLDTIRAIMFMDKRYYETMPKGFYNVIKDTPLTKELLQDYVDKLTYGKYYKFVREFDSELINNYFEQGGTMETLFKIIKNSLLNGNFDIAYNTNKLLKLIQYVGCDLEQKITLDDNRDLEHNIQTLRDIADRERNIILAKKLQKLNFINGVEYKNLVVVAPQSQEDKQAEGRMQNNCVGYYYDESILEGRNLIYFIRKKDNPNKSYVTCRYNKEFKRTVEYRAFNNNNVHDNNVLEFINILDEKIQKTLS